MLEVDGHTIGQSMTIARYLARRWIAERSKDFYSYIYRSGLDLLARLILMQLRLTKL